MSAASDEERVSLLSSNSDSSSSDVEGGSPFHAATIPVPSSDGENFSSGTGGGKPSKGTSITAKSVFKAFGNGAKGVLGLQGSTDEEKGNFTSSIGALLSMVGTTVGTGNIWRFPRIMASNAEEGGGLVFLLVWLLFLLIWSIPLNLIQFGMGRYTKKCIIESYAKLIGPSYRWLGGFVVGINLLIGAFYSVLLGYCGYYMFFFIINSLPSSLEIAESDFDKLLNSHWPVIFHILFTVLACLAISRGVSTIEPVNRLIVPLLLVIVVFSFYWSLFLPYAGVGLIHMFTPNWKSFGNAQIWRDAMTQNAWDTAAGSGIFITYATYMSKRQGAVKMGVTVPSINNCISLICGMTVFCNVFSYEYLKGSSTEVIIDVLKTNGPFNTGITFIQMPLLYGSLRGGRVLAVLFFFGISLAGLSSLISILEQSVHVLEDFGIKRIAATVFVCFLSSGIGLASALSSDVFVNQDAVWAQALILSGCIFLFLVYRYGPLNFRKDLYNKFGIGDWHLPLLWVIVVVFVCPVEGVGMVLWWIIDEVVYNSDPYKPNSPWWDLSHPTSLYNVLVQWTILACIVIGLNWWMKPITRKKKPFDRPQTDCLSRMRDFFIRSETVKIVLPSRPPLLSEDLSSSDNSLMISQEPRMKESSLTFSPRGSHLTVKQTLEGIREVVTPVEIYSSKQADQVTGL